MKAQDEVWDERQVVGRGKRCGRRMKIWMGGSRCSRPLPQRSNGG